MPSFASAARLRVGEAARVGELARDLLDALQVLDVLLGRDDGHEHVFAERRLAEDLDLHARRGGFERLEVRRDLPVVGELPVRADLEPEELRRRRDLRGARAAEEIRSGSEDAAKPAVRDATRFFMKCS